MARITGYRIKGGKVVKAARKTSVSQKIQARKNPKTRVQRGKVRNVARNAYGEDVCE